MPDKKISQLDTVTPTSDDLIAVVDSSDLTKTKKSTLASLPLSDEAVAALSVKEDTANKGIPNGYAPLDATGKVPSSNLPAASGGGHVIQDEGVSLTQRAKLDFVGANVTVTDDAGNDSTVVTIEGGIENVYSNVSTIYDSIQNDVFPDVLPKIITFSDSIGTPVSRRVDIQASTYPWELTLLNDSSVSVSVYEGGTLETVVASGRGATFRLGEGIVVPAFFPLPTAAQVGAVDDSATITINGEVQNLSDSPDFTISTGAGASAANVYLQSTASPVVGTYKDLAYSLQTATTTLSVVVNNNEVKIADFLFPLQVDTSIIDVGTWNFHFHAFASSTVGTTKLRYVPFKRSSAGVETDLFSLTSSEINSTSADLYVDSTSQNFFAVDPTDRLGLRVYASTTRNANTTVSILIGDGEASFFNAPIALRHSQLRDRDAADSHPADAISFSDAGFDATDVDAALVELNTEKASLAGASFTGDVTVPDEAYGAGWNGSTEAPTKGSIYTKIESIPKGKIFEFAHEGPLVVGYLGKAVVTSPGTLSAVKASIDVLNTVTSAKIDVRKNGTATTNSVFTSDTPLEIATSTSATNGVYTVTDDLIDNGTLAVNDVVRLYVTQIGSGVAGSNLYVVGY